MNCYGVIAPVQAWSFANSLFDTRQAKRLFGLVGSGASLGAITGGVLARLLVEPVGGTINLLLVLALLIALAAAIVLFANLRIRARRLTRRGPELAAVLRDLARNRRKPVPAADRGLVFAVAIATQWTSFQLSVVAKRPFSGDSTDLTQFYGTFNFLARRRSAFWCSCSSPGACCALGRLGHDSALPLALGDRQRPDLPGPGVLAACSSPTAFDQGLRFSVDKATYELLYLPIAPGDRGRSRTPSTSSSTASPMASARCCWGCDAGVPDAARAAARLRGTAAVNLVTVGSGWRWRGGCAPSTCGPSRTASIGTGSTPSAAPRRSPSDRRPTCSRRSSRPRISSEVRYALDLMEGQHTRKWHPALRALLTHPDADIRRRALAILSAGGDDEIADRVPAMLRDPGHRRPDRGAAVSVARVGHRSAAADPGAGRLRGLLDPRRDGGVSRRPGAGAESRGGAARCSRRMARSRGRRRAPRPRRGGAADRRDRRPGVRRPAAAADCRRGPRGRAAGGARCAPDGARRARRAADRWRSAAPS